VKRNELQELTYITPIANVTSILRLGIHSYKRAAKIAHHSVAMEQIQQRRKQVRVPGGRPLHEYVNLYICARNPMMYVRRSQHLDLCVLRVDCRVLDLPGVVVTDGNASSDYVAFAPAPRGLAKVDQELTFADNWTDPNPIEYFRRKAAKCAEVLVPDQVPPDHIMGAYVSCEEGAARLAALQSRLTATIDGHLFFQ
jgi:hypothetical protein